VPTEKTERLLLDSEPLAIQQTRTRLRETLERAGVAAARQRDALLIVSELVTNAIEHGSGERDEIEVAWTLSSGTLRVAVIDAARGAGRPVTLTPNEERPRGRGLHIVDQLADWWDERIIGGRREVAFQLHL
jgi:anti-sigma regulatory factor (Ser/Thr protein kinase)